MVVLLLNHVLTTEKVSFNGLLNYGGCYSPTMIDLKESNIIRASVLDYADNKNR